MTLSTLQSNSLISITFDLLVMMKACVRNHKITAFMRSTHICHYNNPHTFCANQRAKIWLENGLFITFFFCKNHTNIIKETL